MMKRFVSYEGWSPSRQDHPWQTGQRVDEQFLSGLRAAGWVCYQHNRCYWGLLRRVWVWRASHSRLRTRLSTFSDVRTWGLKTRPVKTSKGNLNQSVSRVCCPCRNKVRSTWVEFYITKTSFQESKHDDDSFRKNVRISSWFRCRQGNWMAEMSASLVASTWSLIIILHNYDATNTKVFSFCLCFTVRTTGKLNFSQNPCGKKRHNIFLPQ